MKDVIKKKKVIIDCDPGHDDAIAILLAGRSPYINLQAITVVAGNQILEKTTRNTLNICSAMGITNVPIAAGMSKPIVREQIIASNVHGETGLDGPIFDKPTVQLDPRHGVDLIIELLMKSDEDITIVPMGPLTNVGMAIIREPRIVPKIKQIVLMGGAYQLGNVTPAAEFNIYADPEAAHIVFSCGRPIVMMGLDLTRQALATPKVIAKMKSIGNKASNLFVDLMEFFTKTQHEVFGWDSPPVHDPTTIAWLIDPNVIETKPMHVEIELTSGKSYGRTLCDYFGITQRPANAKVAIKLDFDKFWNIVYETLKLY